MPREYRHIEQYEKEMIELKEKGLSPLCSSPRHLHNIPCTKIRGFGMRISYSPIFGISKAHFFL